MPYVITDACVDIMDRTCVDLCPVDCIQQGERMLYINPDDCIDCGACEPVCPQNAIYLADSLPAPLSGYQAINADFYAAADFGPAVDERTAAVDHPAVAQLPHAAA
jgi:NAD-dependent dihydropyrimidine dehydrogenase PreA subunit